MRSGRRSGSWFGLGMVLKVVELLKQVSIQVMMRGVGVMEIY